MIGQIPGDDRASGGEGPASPPDGRAVPPRIARNRCVPPAVWHVGFVSLLFLLTSPGQLTNSDSRVYLAQAESLWLGEWLDITRRRPEAGNMGLACWVEDRWGVVRGIYPPGMAIALGPGVLLGRVAFVLTGWDRATVVLPSAWLCLLMGTGYWLLLRALVESGVEPRAASAAALVTFLGDRGVWFVRGQIFSENLLAPALALVLRLEVAYRARPSRARALALGAALGALPWVHAQLWPVAVVLAVVWGLSGRGRPSGPDEAAPASAWLVPGGASLLAGLLVVYNCALFGSPLAGGYGRVLDDWLRTTPAALPLLAGAIRYHWSAVLGVAGLVLSLLRPAGLAREDRSARAWAIPAALVAHAVLLCFWQVRQENQLKRFLIVEAVLLAPYLARLFQTLQAGPSGRPTFGAKLGSSAHRTPELVSAVLVVAAFAAMLLDGMFVARVELAGGLVAAPRVWWVVLGLTRSALGWVFGGLVAAGAAISGYLAWRTFDAAVSASAPNSDSQARVAGPGDAE